MNPITLTVWVLAQNVPAVVLMLLLLIAVVLTAAVHEGRHPR